MYENVINNIYFAPDINIIYGGYSSSPCYYELQPFIKCTRHTTVGKYFHEDDQIRYKSVNFVELLLSGCVVVVVVLKTSL